MAALPPDLLKAVTDHFLTLQKSDPRAADMPAKDFVDSLNTSLRPRYAQFLVELVEEVYSTSPISSLIKDMRTIAERSLRIQQATSVTTDGNETIVGKSE